MVISQVLRDHSGLLSALVVKQLLFFFIGAYCIHFVSSFISSSRFSLYTWTNAISLCHGVRSGLAQKLSGIIRSPALSRQCPLFLSVSRRVYYLCATIEMDGVYGKRIWDGEREVNALVVGEEEEGLGHVVELGLCGS